MGSETKISWTDSTWNPWRGCTKVSPGCTNCYAEKLVTTRLGGEWGKGKPRIRAAKATFNAPLSWNKRPWVCDKCGTASEVESGCECWTFENPVTSHLRRVFLGSLMDWLDDEVPIEWLADVLDIIRRCDQLEWITVTKRPELFTMRMRSLCEWYDSKRPSDADDKQYCWLGEWVNGLEVPPNLTVLTSVEDQAMMDLRGPQLLKIPAARRGLSMEPLLGPVDLTPWLDQTYTPHGSSGTRRYSPSRLDWIIVGGESGPNARPCAVEWIRSIVNQAQFACVPVFVKQLGRYVVDPESNSPVGMQECPDHKGAVMADWPADLRVQQFPF